MSTRSSTAALRGAVIRCTSRLEHGLGLAQLALRGDEPEDAARYILAAVSAIEGDLEVLRHVAPEP